MPSLPLDLHITILSFLSPARCRSPDDEAIRTFISYSETNALLREASLVPHIWKAHYCTRYRHSDKENEEQRKLKHNGNWRLMYQERRRMDRMSLELLRGITLWRMGRIDKVLILSKLSLDVWDVLDLEAERELPPVLSFPQMDPPYMGTQRYWARCMLEVIAREQAVGVWTTLPSTISVPQSDRASFEQTMLALSGFFGKSIQDLTDHLEELAIDCRRYIQDRNITLNPQSPYYDIPTICKSICRFMLDKGFSPADSDSVFEILGQFPHAYLSTHKRTLPMALIQIFVSLARRLDLDASPVNFPRTVICHIPSTREGERPFYVNAFLTDPDSCMLDVQGSLWFEASLFTAPEQLSHYLAPADAPTMLIRVARNLLTSFTRRGPLPYDISQNCLYITTIIHLLFNGDINAITQLLNTVDLRPIDCATFLTNRLAPVLTTPAKVLLESFCKPILDNEDLRAATVRFRGTEPPIVKYFIGLPFRHRRYGYIACIASWDEDCAASEEWIKQMGVDALERGRHQPFYTCFVLDAGNTQRYVAEENIEPTPLSVDYIAQFFEKHSNMFMCFQSVELEETDEPKEVKRWRMVLSPELSFGYPEDEVIGSVWVKEGILPHLNRPE